jgi:RalA-binding protein 1
MASKPLDEEPVFTLSVISRSEMAELWRVEKVIASLPQLDNQIRQLASFAGKLPDRTIFSGHSPAKVDARRAALNTYFDSLLDTPMDERAALVICQFLTNDAIEPRDDETSLVKGSGQAKQDMPRGPDGKPRKEGYLTKRGKNFGGWKARYFVLHGPELKYYESPGGPHMGTIKLLHAQIGKQSQNSNGQSNSPPGAEEDTDNQYRHAFLILEPKKKDSSALVRHVLCGESDEERDQWVDALMEYVEAPSSDTESRGNASSKQTQPKSSGAGSKTKGSKDGNKRSGRGVDSPDQEGGSAVQGFSFDDTVAAEPPIIGSSIEQAPRSPQIPGLSTDFRDLNQSGADPTMQSPKIISGPTNGTVIQDVGAWGNKPTATTTSVKEKKRSIWGFRTRSSFDLAAQASETAAPVERRENVKPVFGIPLAEAVQDCGPIGVEADLPAVVYRCIEYLHSKDAALEEGIFRLSGSNVVIKALKERFNNEGDVDFLTGDQYYDVHAVASLFKQYLRELPTTVLTRELHLDFLRVLGMTPVLFSLNSIIFQKLINYIQQNSMISRRRSLPSMRWSTDCQSRIFHCCEHCRYS